MKITRIEVGFGVTYNLGDYSNCRPEISLAAEVEEGDDPTGVLFTLDAQARSYIHGFIDDELEENGKSPVYYDGPLFSAWYAEARGIVVLAPHETKPPEARNWREGDHWYYIDGARAKRGTAERRWLVEKWPTERAADNGSAGILAREGAGHPAAGASRFNQ